MTSVGRTQIWGILNVTPDSFSDGGEFDTAESAIAQGRALVAAGADVIDVGGESTRPGADRIPVDTELKRILPVIAALSAEGITVSVDTMRADVARAAVAAGASIINDVSGGKADAQMFETVAELGVDYVLMHWRGFSTEMDSLARYDDVVSEVVYELRAQLELAIAVGVDAKRIIVDPGFGFAKLPEHNWRLLQELTQLQQLGHRVLIGASRKRFLAEFGSAPRERDLATSYLSLYSALKGCYAVRVHEVLLTRTALQIAAELGGGDVS